MSALLDLGRLCALFAPAFLVARSLRSRPQWLQAVGDTMLLAVTLVPIPAFTIALVTRTYLTDTLVMSVSAVATLAGLGLALWRFGVRGLWGGLSSALPRERGDKWVVAAAGLLFVVFLVNYDGRHFQYGCINGVVMQALLPEAAGAFDPHGGKDEDAPESEDWGAPTQRASDAPMGLLDVHGTGQRLGTTAVISPVVALFQVFGFRLIYALLPAMALLFAVRMGQAIGAPRWASLAAGVATLANPYVLKVVILDENVMACCFGIAAIATALEGGRVGATLAGVAFGAALGIRHIDLPLGLTVAMLLGRHPKNLAILALSGLAFALPCALHHHFTYGSVFRHEHFVDEVFLSIPHHFLGWTFDYTGLLNWPFFERYVRTPYNPFPTVFYYPLNVLAHLGTVLCAVAVIGAGVVAARRRSLLAALLVWLVPVYALLAVLENWMDPNKMGVIITLFPALVPCFALGFTWLARTQARARRLGTWLAVSLALSATAWASDLPRFDDDPRFYEKYPRVRAERPEYYDFERKLLTHGAPWPSSYFLQQYTRLNLSDRLTGLARDASDRRFRRPPHDAGLDSDSPPVTLRIDLTAPLISGPDFASLGESDGLLVDARPAGTAVVIAGLRAWEPSPADVLVARDGNREVGVYLRFGEDGFADVTSDRVFSIEQRPRPTLVTREGAGTRTLSLTVRAGDTIRIRETVALDEVLVYVWDLEVEDGRLAIHRPTRMFHN